MQITKFFSILIYFYLNCKGLLINTFFSYFFYGKKVNKKATGKRIQRVFRTVP